VVVCSELPADEGASVTNAAEQLAAEVIRYHRLSAPVVWVEHHPPETTGLRLRLEEGGRGRLDFPHP
jgi:hypothetical protein